MRFMTTILFLSGCFKIENKLAEDIDGDGLTPFDGDCDDNDKSLGDIAFDADCDGIPTVDDCNDEDPESVNDMDCDGILTIDDCNDADPTSTSKENDADCDTFVNEIDCNDNDPNSTNTDIDADCDTVLTNDDCNDNNENSTIRAEDGDCDGVLTIDDCDDSLSSLLDKASDGDCDGSLTSDDCDDNDPFVGNMSTDMDCDGSTSEVDCNDGDPNTYPGAAYLDSSTACLTDADGDGYGSTAAVTGPLLCYTFEMADTFGDGWNGNSIALYEAYGSEYLLGNDEYALIDTLTLESGSSGSYEYCIDTTDTFATAFVYYAGDYSEEISFNITNDEGDVIGNGTGISNGTVEYNNTIFSAGEIFEEIIFYIPTPNESLNIGTDCDDNNPDLLSDLNDMDCDGVLTEEDCDDTNPTLSVNEDNDNDGVGNCEGDCDDNNPDISINIDADGDGYGTCDGDCDDNDPTLTINVDADGDGYGTCDEDCDDSNTGVSPGNSEICDGIDNNCNGLIDDNTSDASTYYQDLDGDGFGDLDASTVNCYQPYGYVSNADDCDDNDATINPAATEISDDGIDNDCVDGDSSLPSIVNIILEPIPVHTNETLTAIPNISENTPVSYTYEWLVNNQVVGQNTSSLDGEYFEKYDEITVNVTPYFSDYNATGSSFSISTEVENTAPVIDSLEILPQTPILGSDNLACIVTVSDIDGDEVSTAYSWTDPNGITATTSSTVLADDVTEGTWMCEVQVFDDSGSGSTYSATVEVSNLSSIDMDQDGIMANVDCDDEDPSIGSSADDYDCDGVLTADDCDDSDNTNTSSIVDDADCDGVLTADDCNDEDASSTVIANDADCDGVLTADDCDDEDPNIGDTTTMYYLDVDGDGFGVSAEDFSPISSCTMPEGCSEFDTDCDDSDTTINPSATENPNEGDKNCDGIETGDLSVADLQVGDLQITEIMINPSAVSDNDGEWFEVYVSDTLSGTVQLNGLVLSNISAGSEDIEILSTNLLVSGGSYIIFASESDASLNGGLLPDAIFEFGLNNTGEIVGLWSEEGATTAIDSVDVDGSGSTSEGVSLAKDEQNTWCAAIETYGDGDLGTPGAVNNSCQEYECTDGVDNDGDGSIDCSDSDCSCQGNGVP